MSPDWADPVRIVRTLPGYFEAAGVRLLRGRLFGPQDSLSESAILSSSAAAILFPGQEALGRPFVADRGGRFTIVGIVDNVRMTPDRPVDPLAYVPVDASFDGRPNGAFTFVALAALRRLPEDACYRDWMAEICAQLPSTDYPQQPGLQGTSRQRGWTVLT